MGTRKSTYVYHQNHFWCFECFCPTFTRAEADKGEPFEFNHNPKYPATIRRKQYITKVRTPTRSVLRAIIYWCANDPVSSFKCSRTPGLRPKPVTQEHKKPRNGSASCLVTPAMRCSIKATLQPGGGTTGSHKVFPIVRSGQPPFITLIYVNSRQRPAGGGGQYYNP